VNAKAEMSHGGTKIISTKRARDGVGYGAIWFFDEAAARAVARKKIDPRVEVTILGHEMPRIIGVVVVRAQLVINNARERIAPTLGDVQIQKNSIRLHFQCFL
jgi:hypothetical protein